MTRIAGADAYGLMEAYAAVYASQELTEEQIWEEVENWVNSLLEEGYDLSDYTWEDMYEEYLNEMGQRATTGQLTAPRNAPTQAAVKPTPSPAYRPAGGGMGGLRGSGRDRTSYQTSSSPGALRVQPTPTAKPVPTPTAKPVPTPTPTAKPVPTPTAKPVPTPTAKPVPTPTAKPVPTPTPIAKPAPTPTPTAKPTGGVQAMSKLPGGDYSVAATSMMSQRTKNILGTKDSATGKITPPARLGSARERMLNQDLDLFDIIKGHLLDEGYAETEEAAVVIMANMSEEWKQEILDSKEI